VNPQISPILTNAIWITPSRRHAAIESWEVTTDSTDHTDFKIILQSVESAQSVVPRFWFNRSAPRISLDDAVAASRCDRVLGENHRFHRSHRFQEHSSICGICEICGSSLLVHSQRDMDFFDHAVPASRCHRVLGDNHRFHRSHRFQDHSSICGICAICGSSLLIQSQRDSVTKEKWKSVSICGICGFTCS
jgi:hypothetical protein